jgi:hypothetical protein
MIYDLICIAMKNPSGPIRLLMRPPPLKKIKKLEFCSRILFLLISNYFNKKWVGINKIKKAIVLNPERVSMQNRNCWCVCPRSDWLKNSTNRISANWKLNQSSVFLLWVSANRIFSSYGLSLGGEVTVMSASNG